MYLEPVDTGRKAAHVNNARVVAGQRRLLADRDRIGFGEVKHCGSNGVGWFGEGNPAVVSHLLNARCELAVLLGFQKHIVTCGNELIFSLRNVQHRIQMLACQLIVSLFVVAGCAVSLLQHGARRPELGRGAETERSGWSCSGQATAAGRERVRERS